MEPFTINVPDETLTDLRARLARTRFPGPSVGAPWDQGTDASYLRSLCDYWRDEFDWRAAERTLNRFPQFRAEIDGRKLHFIHQRSARKDALPIVIAHGWPGSVWEFHKIIDRLADPALDGGDPGDAFHVVCPSMPGYGFSDPPAEPGFDIREVARVNANLMEKLGYERYGAQGGDWGALATAWIARLVPERIVGAHMNMVVTAPPPKDEMLKGLSAEEVKRLARAREILKAETGYQAIQGTRPQTLGYGLNDSPAGLAAWIVEKFRAWSDCGGDIESRFTKDDLLANIMIYWVTGTITSSMCLYFESKRSMRFGPGEGRVEIPCAFAVFPGELAHPPRAWAQRQYNIVRWTEMPRGGHFAALEEPDLLVEDIREFFRPLRSTLAATHS